MNLQLDDDLVRLLAAIQESAPGERVYLVGGAVRDLLLSRPSKDLDFVLADGSIPLAKAVCRRLNGTMYVLDDVRHSARVFLNQGRQNERILDFTTFIGGGLEEDLRQRDFTINAIAVELRDLNVVIDPLGGQDDLLARRMRLCGADSLRADPLRTLRGVRLCSGYGLEYDAEIVSSMRVAVRMLGSVSGERIRDELFKCLSLPQFDRVITLLQKFGILDQLRLLAFGTDPTQSGQSESQLRKSLLVLLEYLEFIDHADKRSKMVEAFFAEESARLAYSRMLHEVGQGGRQRRSLLILCALMLNLHPVFDVAKPSLSMLDPKEFADNITRCLLLGQKENGYLRAAAGAFCGVAELSKAEPKELDYYRFFRNYSSFGLDGALLAWVELVADCPRLAFSREMVRQIFDVWFNSQVSVVNPPQLVDGTFLMRELGIPPGSLVGVLLESIRQQQVLGKVSTTEDALIFARGEIARRSYGENKAK